MSDEEHKQIITELIHGGMEELNVALLNSPLEIDFDNVQDVKDTLVGIINECSKVYVYVHVLDELDKRGRTDVA